MVNQLNPEDFHIRVRFKNLKESTIYRRGIDLYKVRNGEEMMLLPVSSPSTTYHFHSGKTQAVPCDDLVYVRPGTILID